MPHFAQDHVAQAVHDDVVAAIADLKAHLTPLVELARHHLAALAEKAAAELESAPPASQPPSDAQGAAPKETATG